MNAEDIRNLREAAGRRGYALPEFDPRTGKILDDQWRSWKRLQRLGLGIIEGDGEAQDLVITAKGCKALRKLRRSP